MPSTRDAIYIEYNQTAEAMKGISPKLSLYKKLEEKLNELQKEIGNQGRIFIPFKRKKGFARIYKNITR